MDGIFVLAILSLLFLLIGALLGVVAFLRVNRLARELEEIAIKIRYSSLKTDREPDDEHTQQADSRHITSATEAEKTDQDKMAVEQSEPGPDEPVVEDQEPDQPSGAQEADEEIPVKQAARVKQAKSGRNLEETIGSLWAVWVGGLALALGAVFLVKFSIERGLLSPGVRILLGLLFSGTLIVLGEWTRRRGSKYSFAGFANANIPAILTAAGTMGAFSTIYAAYELYNMLTPLVAFLGLGVVAVATTFAALLHGPLLAALGILASFVAPLLISTDSPSVPGLAFYILAVSASGYVVGRLRLWKWLAVAISAGLLFYGIILHDIVSYASQIDRLAFAAYVVFAWSMNAHVFIISLYQRSIRNLDVIDKTACILLGLLLALVLASSLTNQADFTSSVLLLGAIAGPFSLAIYYSAARAVVYASMLISAIGYLGWSIDFSGLSSQNGIDDIEVLLANFQVREKLSMFTWIGLFMAAVAAGLGLWGVTKSASRAALAIGGAFLPLLLLGVHYIRFEEFSSSWSYAFVALLMFVGYLAVSNFVFTRFDVDEEGRDSAAAAYSVASFVALSLSAAFVLEKAALTITLALLVPAIAYTYNRRPLPALRPLAALASLLWIGRVIWEPSIIGGDLGTTPIFNWLTYGYGIPTAGFAVATWLVGQSKRDLWLEALEGVTLASFVATLGLVGLHAIDPAQVFSPIDTIEEAALMTIIGCGVAIGLLAINRTRTSKVLGYGVTLLGIWAMIVGAIGLLVMFNPWLNRDDIGAGWIINSLLFSYAFPGILYLVLGWYAINRRPLAYIYACVGLGALLLATWVNLTIRHIYHPFGLQRGATSDGELYTYSIVWLLIGIAILAAGIVWRIKPLRLASVGILALVVAKVFLVDMAGLEGILRALSFIGLGATLIGIGFVYQRILSKPDFAHENPDDVEIEEPKKIDGL